MDPRILLPRLAVCPPSPIGRVARRGVSLLLLALLSSVVSAAPPEEPSEPCGDDCSADVPYRHPLIGVAPVQGLLPTVDLQDAPGGGRYALFDRMLIADEEGTPRVESGVEVLSARPLTVAERRELDAENLAIADFEPAVISPVVERALVDARPGETLDLVLTFDRGNLTPLDQEMHRAIATGTIATREDYEVKRLELLALRARDLAKARAPVVEAIEKIGGQVLSECRNLSCLTVRIDTESVRRLESIAEVRRVELDVATQANGDGGCSRDGHQVTHVVADFDGEGPTFGASDTLWAGMIESCLVRSTHLTFNDGPTNSNRYFLYDCTTGTCDWQNITGSVCDHATEVASTIFGDTEDGQVPNVTGVAGSGMAPEANAYLYRVGTFSNMTAAWDHLTTRANKVHATNMSISLENHPPYDCSGTDATSQLADEFYETGTLLVMAAGNDGGDTDECRVEMPGSAVSVFTVGGHGSNAVGCNYDADDIRTADIHPASAWGGFLDEPEDGRGRRIIDLTAHYFISNRADSTGDSAFDSCSPGTSFAAPLVTGAAIDFVDFYKQTYSDFIDNPGSLASNLLTLGDRARPGGGKRSWGFDNRFGAGRLKMRRFDGVGLDGPSYYYNGSVCVDHDQVVELTLNGGSAFSQDFDDLKAVIWWYDPGFHHGQALDDIELYLRTTSNSLLRYSASGYANKEMVKFTDIGGRAVKLQIIGDRVTEDNVGCGTNSMRVFFTVYAEDGDREAWENLDDVERM